MTDDSAAEKKALKVVWDESTQLLCHFHVAQAEWRWLFSHNIKKEDRPFLMNLFQCVMHAASEEELQTAYENLLKETERYPEFVKRFLKFFERREDWVKWYRRNLITRQNNTNNYAEASIRILKDVILHRTKAFNVVALCEFCIDVWEKYLVKKILDFASSRKLSVFLMYASLQKKVADFKESNVEEIGADVFSIKSGEKTYIVKSDVGVCSCPAGISGAFCKHQFFLMQLKKLSLPNAPPTGQTERHNLSILALGPKCPPESFFSDFVQAETPVSNPSVVETADTAESEVATSIAEEEVSNLASSELKMEMLTELDRIKNIL
ncbi:uncharacterized protein LOC129228699 [Uloborus diversus]|uniref:uncharacterized protein LOC129228699 n=1 Tax=Uloborus diversus TaxID=327109 RepID=UPI00240A815C|nr:uncharacterized protein LOC129228699 [Uloborus diversus]